jgi:hypothetical protein
VSAGEWYEAVPFKVKALRLAEDGSNWRDFDGWLGWDMMQERCHWDNPDPDTVTFLDAYVNGVYDMLMPGDWIIIREDGDRSICPNALFRKMYWR